MNQVIEIDNVTRLEDFHVKIKNLIILHEDLKDQYRKLKSLNKELLSELHKHELTIKELEEQNRIIKLAKSLSGSDQNTRDMKLKINQMIREIDKSIALLNT